MAEGKLPPQLYLSSLDPGTGKTLLIKHFIKTLLRSPHHEDVAVLVCLSRLEEVEKMWQALEEERREVAIWTGDERCNAKSTIPANEARVLLTTQQKLEAVCRGKSFRASTGFHYLGGPRSVRIWDESLLPGKEVFLRTDDLAGLLGYLRHPAPELHAALDRLRDQLRQASGGNTIDVPGIEEMGGEAEVFAIRRLLAASDTPALDRERLERLIQVAGRTLPVHRSNQGDTILLDTRDTLPSDLAPMVILDASGRCRETYNLMETKRGTLKRLPAAEKDYSNLEIGLWAKGSSKASHQLDTAELLIRGIAEKIAERPDEEWLILHHKEQTHLRERVEAHLPDGMANDNLHFLTWGNHHGTNAFADVPNVILASLLFLPPEVYQARALLCAGWHPTDGVTTQTSKAMQHGELQHDVLQGLCRASVRRMQLDGTCAPCRAWIIAAKTTGLERSLLRLFPGCQLRPWRPTGTAKLSRSMCKALAVIDQWDKEGFGDEIIFADIADEIGMDRKDFKTRVAKTPLFREELAERGYAEVRLQRNTGRGARTAKGIVRTALVSDFPIDPDAEDIL